MGQDCIGIVYDFYHVFGMEDCGQAVYSKPDNKLFLVHIADGNQCCLGNYLDANRVWPGEGNAGICNQIKILEEIHYKGQCSKEIYASMPWKFDMETCYKIARKKLIG